MTRGPSPFSPGDLGTNRTAPSCGRAARSLPWWSSVCLGVSAANEAGEHAFLAILEDNSTAAYRMDAAGKLSLILKSGTTTDLGTITQVGSGDAAPNLNSKGQVALTVQLDGGNDTLALLTPTAPQQ